MVLDFEGSLRIAAEAPAIWQALLDPQSLIACTPEIESLTAVEPGREYEGLATVQFGSQRLSFPLRARWVELEPERYGRLAAVIVAAGHQLKLHLHVTLTADGGQQTDLQWQAALIRPTRSDDESPSLLWQLAANLARQRLEGFTRCLKASLESGQSSVNSEQ